MPRDLLEMSIALLGAVGVFMAFDRLSHAQPGDDLSLIWLTGTLGLLLGMLIWSGSAS